MNHNKKPGWIYPNDLCWLKVAHLAFPADNDWTYSDRIQRLLDTDDPIRYVRRTREGRGGTWIHHIESLGLRYVFKGSIHSFSKDGPITPSERW